MVEFNYKQREIDGTSITADLEINGQKITTPDFGINHSEFKSMRYTAKRFSLSNPPAFVESILHVDQMALNEGLFEFAKNKLRNNIVKKTNFQIMEIPIVDTSLPNIKFDQIADLISAHFEAERAQMFVLPDHPKLSFSNFQELTIDAMNFGKSIDSGFRLIPQINLRQSRKQFQAKFFHILDTQPLAINLFYRGVRSIDNLNSVISDLKSLDNTWVHMTNVTKTIGRDNPSSHPHLASTRAIDSISTEITRKVGYNPKSKGSDKPTKKKRYLTASGPSELKNNKNDFPSAPSHFIKDELAYQPQPPKVCNCSVCSTLGKTIDNITDITEFKFDKMYQFRYATKTHELQMQIDEERNLRNAINKNEIRLYLNQKPTIIKFSKQLNNKYPGLIKDKGQSTLDDYFS